VSAVAQNLVANLEESFLLFIESVPDAMVLSNREGRIVLVNINTEKLFGYRRDELLGKKVEILIPARFRAGHRRHRAAYYADPSIRPMGIGRDLFGSRKDGTEFPVQINLSPVQIRGEHLVWSAIRGVGEREAFTAQVRIALNKRRVLRGLISICAWCKRIRDERGSWQRLESYIESHSETKFTHGLCRDCLQRLDPELIGAPRLHGRGDDE
jgi:PAS domain S-box-containing protein